MRMRPPSLERALAGALLVTLMSACPSPEHTGVADTGLADVGADARADVRTGDATAPDARADAGDANRRCGNGVVEDGEVCDGDCPRDPSSCTDAPNACTGATVEGDPDACQSVCQYDAITECVDGDGCCAVGCGARTDSDCEPLAVGDRCADNPEACSGSSRDLVCLTRDTYPDVPEDGVCARRGCDTSCPNGEACTRLNGEEFFCIRACTTGCPRSDTQCRGILCL